MPMFVAHNYRASCYIAELCSSQRNRRAISGTRAVHRLAVLLDPPYACRPPRRKYPHEFIRCQFAAPHRTGDDCARPLDRESAIDREAKEILTLAGDARRELSYQYPAQVVEALARPT